MFLTDHKPKRTRRYDGNHVNIASFVNRFQTWQKTEHGRNNNMKAFGELDALTTKQCMTKQAYIQQDGMFIKISMARENT